MKLDELPIEELELGVRAYNIMKRINVNTIGDLAGVSAHDLNEYTEATGIAIGMPATEQLIEAQRWIAERKLQGN